MRLIKLVTFILTFLLSSNIMAAKLSPGYYEGLYEGKSCIIEISEQSTKLTIERFICDIGTDESKSISKLIPLRINKDYFEVNSSINNYIYAIKTTKSGIYSSFRTHLGPKPIFSEGIEVSRYSKNQISYFFMNKKNSKGVTTISLIKK